MSETSAHRALERRKTLLEMEPALIDKANALNNTLFSKRLEAGDVTETQMNALSMKIYLGAGLKAVKDEVRTYLANQQDKLRKRQERTGKATSWLKPAKAGADADGNTVGGTITDWLNEARYLPQDHRKGLDAELELAALKRFWAHMHSLYRYKALFGKNICLQLGTTATDKD